ncbi:MAG: universal stress protein [Proteobacteria bacterium]|nr:universal stress protein [Pseudomonadota bacterium]
MKTFKKILAVTDLSSESLSAVSYAGHLARAQGASLVVLHVAHSTTVLFTEFVPGIDMTAIDEEIETAARERLGSWAKRHLRKVEQLELIVRRGLVPETVCEVAAETGASIIAMATHGRTGVGRMVLGSVTEKVLARAPCPVLVVRPPNPVVEVKSG